MRCSTAIASSFLIAAAASTACTTGDGVTGPATLTADGVALPVVSAWATDIGRDYVYNVEGGLPLIAYVPWTVVFSGVPADTACGEMPRSLYDDTLGWRAEIDLAVPFATADNNLAQVGLHAGALPVEQLVGPAALTAPAAQVVLYPYSVDRVLTAGTVTITEFDDTAVVGRLSATAADGTTAEATFTANRCAYPDPDAD
jgi:hypothetical protein